MPMHPHWHAALSETTQDDAGSVAQGQVADIVSPLTEQGVIQVEGADAREFLHAQLSNSVTDLGDQETRLAAWCTPKGRTLALMRVVPTTAGFLLLLDRSLIAYTLKRLKLFVLRSEVTLTDLTDEWAAIGLAGSEALRFVGNQVGDLPDEPESVTWTDDLAVVRLPATEPRAMLLGPATAVVEQWHEAAKALAPTDNETWNLRLVRDGQPDITAATSDSFVPQMLNLQPLGGLSFTKGCYPGQEVVARLHYRGQLKRRVYRLALPADRAPEPGTELDDGVGIILTAAAGPEAVEALAVIGVEAADRGDIRYGGEAVSFSELPYEKPEA
jgi:folate-binding protein YgfZ